MHPSPVSRRRAGFYQYATTLAALLAAFATGSSTAAERTLTDVDYVELGGQRVQLTLTLSGPAPEPKAFTIDAPARLSLDLPDTRLGLGERRRDINIGSVRSVAFAEGSERTRVVVSLTNPAAYETSVTGNQIQVRIGAAGGQSRLSEAAQPARRQSAGANAAATQINNLDFRRTETGAGRVAVDVTAMNAPVDVSQQGGKIVARFPNVSLPQALIKRLDVIDFATPVKYVDAVNTATGARISLTPIDDADFDQIAYQAENRFIIELQPVSQAERDRDEQQPAYEGENISLSFQNVDVRALLQIIADVAEVNMVVSESVGGSMALQLDEVPWDQALEIILASNNLGMRRQGNVIMVAPLTEISAREQAEFEAEQSATNLAPLSSEIIQINYARAGEFAALLQAAETSLLSERGQVAVDERTNTLLVRETRQKLREIQQVINRLDIPVQQVLIESRIVVANRDFSRDLGVSANVADSAAIESPDGGNLLVDSGFSVNLPAANPAGVLTTSILGDTFNLDLALSALESENRGEIISSPRVITANAREANIEQGTEIPFLEAASSGAATIQFKEAVLSLTVTPQITPDGSVIMDLFVTQDSVGQLVSVQGGGQVPSIDTRTLTTQLLVENGETVVLGGIYEQEDREVINRVPILGKIPLLGALFRNTSKTRDKRELLLFVTPKILKQGLALK